MEGVLPDRGKSYHRSTEARRSWVSVNQKEEVGLLFWQVVRVRKEDLEQVARAGWVPGTRLQFPFIRVG